MHLRVRVVCVCVPVCTCVCKVVSAPQPADIVKANAGYVEYIHLHTNTCIDT